MRCEQCNRFVSLECGDPEVELIDIDAAGNVNASVRFVRNCAECSTEMKDIYIDFEGEVPDPIIQKHHGEKHELQIEETSCEVGEITGSRCDKNIFKLTLNFQVVCTCQDRTKPIYEGTLEGSCAASEMEEL